MRVELTDEELQHAESLAEARLHEPSRRRSPDRPTARNIESQRRGAVGEIAAARLLREQGFEVVAGFERDAEDECDLKANGLGLEVMTARIAHRHKTGFCVPPNKLWAAQRRRAIGYIFMGTGPESHPRVVEAQRGVLLEHVDLDPVQSTFVNNPNSPVDNYVVRPENLIPPEDFFRLFEA